MRRTGYLPSPPNPLIGRTADLEYLDARLSAEGPLGIQLLTLVGPPGTGKTRLAIAAAERVARIYEHGVYFIDLSTVRQVEGAAAAIAHRLGATYRSSRPMSLDQTLKRWLRDRHVLLVLDNFEGVLEAGELVEDLLANCKDLRVLATSRAPLRTTREHQYEVAPLTIPNLVELPRIERLLLVEAVQLFVERVQALRPRWDLTAPNARAVAEICVRLDGLPLAIELAASWMNVLTPQALLKELPHSMNRLDGRAGASGRHQTLDAKIGWSYELLTEAEQRLFRHLAVFENGWTIDTAYAVCADQDASRADILGLLGSLVDKHLITRREGPDGTLRFGFLETIRDYATARLRVTGELPTLQRRHATAIAELTELAEQKLEGPAQAEWIEVLEQERGNIRRTLEWATTTATQEAVEVGLRIAATLWLFWDVRGHVQEGRQPLQELLHLQEAQCATLARARALLSEAWLGYVRGDVAEVDSVAAEALAIADELANPQVRGRILSFLGTTLASYTEQFERSESVLSEALEIGRSLCDTSTTGIALYGLGTAATRCGRTLDSVGFFEGCRQVTEVAGNSFGVGCAVFRLGVLAGASGDRKRAVALLREALHLHWDLRNRRMVALCLQQLACAATGVIEATDQARLFAAAQALFDQLPDYLLPEYLLAAQRQGIETTLQALGDIRFAEAWSEGGRMPLQDVVQRAFVDEKNSAAQSGRGHLSPREVQISQLVAEGLTNREIGVRLGLSYHTVDNHLRRIFSKVDVSSRTGLAMWSVRHGVAPHGG